MPADNEQKIFDVFISYSHKDAEWVRDWLVLRLKQESVSVCIDEESFDIGVSSLINMRNAVAVSRHTLIVLTPAWVESEWSLFESVLSQHRDPVGLRQLTLPLLLLECEVPENFNIFTHADFTGKADIENEFARLLKALRGERNLPDQKRKVKQEMEPPSLNKKADHERANASIPRPPTVGFVTRRDKKGADIVARLKEELAPQKNQLVALWGDGGLGKTTIAAEAARQMTEVFASRIVWTSADGRPDFALSTLLDEMATQLGEPEMRKLALESKKEAVRELIARSDTPALVVLDNFETISPEEQKLCAQWIADHAYCPALITTRARVDRAYHVPIDGMTQPEANEFIDRLIEQTQNSRAFESLDRDRVIKAADANPLVMQWIIAQIDLAQHQSDVLDDLAHGEGDAAERVFDRSFNLPQVGSDGRDTLLALSLFTPSASRLALAEVAGFGDDVRRLREAVKNLAALRLVKTTGADERWIIEGLTRDLAKARLSKDECATDFCHRFVSYFAQYAESHSKTTKEDFDAIEAEKDNLLNAMDIAFEIKVWGNVMQIMYAIGHIPYGFLSLRGYWDEAIQRGEQALKAAIVAQAEWFIGAFANVLGTMLTDRGEYDLAKKYYERAVEVARKLNEEQGLAATLHELARLAQSQGNIDEARRLYNESLEINKKLGNQSDLSGTLHNLAAIAQNQGEVDEARRLYNESLEIAKKLGNQSGIAITLHQLGRLAEIEGEVDEARRLYNESLEIKKRLGDQSGIAITLHNLAAIAQNQGEVDEARRLYNESLEIAKRLGDQSGIAITLHNLAAIAQGQGEIDEARRLYNESMEIKKRLGDQSGIASTLHQLGRLAEEESDYAEAARLFREALNIFEKLKSPHAKIARRSLERVESKMK